MISKGSLPSVSIKGGHRWEGGKEIKRRDWNERKGGK